MHIQLCMQPLTRTHAHTHKHTHAHTRTHIIFYWTSTVFLASHVMHGSNGCIKLVLSRSEHYLGCFDKPLRVLQYWQYKTPNSVFQNTGS